MYDEEVAVLQELFAAKGRGDAAYILDILESPYSTNDNRLLAAKFLGDLGYRPAIDPLRRTLRAGDSAIRVSAIWSLGKLRAAEAVDDLVEFAETDSDEPDRGWAIIALGKIGDSRAVPPLVSLLRDEMHGVRRLAARALGRIGDRAALPALDVAKKQEPWLRRRPYRRAMRAIRRRKT